MSRRLWREPQEGVQLTISCSRSVAPLQSMLACPKSFTQRPSLNELLLPQPKVQNHTYSCSASAFNCIDCGRTFDRVSVKVDPSASFTVMHAPGCRHWQYLCAGGSADEAVNRIKAFISSRLETCPQEHTTCVTEHDKYAKGATKPGGFAASGFYGGGKAAAAQDGPAAAAGLEFLSTRPPWKCSICNVSCTSRETLLGHASGAKHKRRVSALHHPASASSSALCTLAQQPSKPHGVVTAYEIVVNNAPTPCRRLCATNAACLESKVCG